MQADEGGGMEPRKTTARIRAGNLHQKKTSATAATAVTI
jgi:hypothetical protein